MVFFSKIRETTTDVSGQKAHNQISNKHENNEVGLYHYIAYNFDYRNTPNANENLAGKQAWASGILYRLY